ncbi:hypothetical protein NE235_23570 [Actinoallomurus spadix]|uniref:Secreted protein n=1 Tax=Actinoallomurus spadix TaxID=79912 RepID=A0ABP3GP11_9ACTN|nr:hypothetical protein [Actinoallomurus spadix]MCO5989091.1 hypothetical protein [Actinoallomurus spadix]
MSTATVAVIVIVAVLVVVALGLLAHRQQQRRRLRERFGPEYDRTVERHNNTREAEQELRAREQRHRELPIRPLDPAARDRYRADWQRVQEHFVDSPQSAVAEADNLLVRVMKDRGYPTEDYEQQVADLSVEHAGTIGRYRTAHDIRGRADAGRASTEDLRQAMVHYRALFADLLGDDGASGPREPAGTRRADEPDRSGRADEADRSGSAEGPVRFQRVDESGEPVKSGESREDAEATKGRRR